MGETITISVSRVIRPREVLLRRLMAALNWSRTGMAALPRMAGVPLYIAQAENDEPSRPPWGNRRPMR